MYLTRSDFLFGVAQFVYKSRLANSIDVFTVVHLLWFYFSVKSRSIINKFHHFYFRCTCCTSDNSKLHSTTSPIKSTLFNNFEVLIRGKYLKSVETWRVKYCKNDLKRVKFGDCETKWICFTTINKITVKSNKTSRGYSVCFGEKHRSDNKSWNEDDIRNALFYLDSSFRPDG